MSGPLRLGDGRMLVEQLRLLLGNVASSVIPVCLAAILLVFVLSNESNALGLKLWCAAVVASKLYCAWDARRILAGAIAPQEARRMAGVQTLLHALDAVAWAALPWITLDTASLAGSILVVSVLAGILGGSMSSLSPVLPVFAVFSTVLLVLTGAKMWSMGDPAYAALGLAGVLYVGALMGQASNSSKAARASIELKFENLGLIERLRIESGNAQTARREAEQANLAKSKFLAAASHDLRQPIHAQGLFLEVLGRSELNPVQRNVLASASAASQASAEMLNTLLDFSRIEAGVVAPQARTFRLQPLLNKVENELAPQANAKGLIYRSRETHAAAHSDPSLVELILRNLLSNAIRYTENGGILVGCRARGGHVVLEVWDTGIGIESAQQQEVFREFHQLGNPERDHRKGLGLGLAIAQGLARSMGHGLWLVSTPRRGSVFRLSLPAAHATGAGDGLEDVSQPDRAADARMSDVRVLVIDDDEAVREGMQQLLRDWGCECDGAESIEQALALARAHPPGLVISDYRLRELRTGAQAIAALRAQAPGFLPALLITGDTAPERLREASASGVPLLHKPVSPTQLYHRITSVLQDSPPA